MLHSGVVNEPVEEGLPVCSLCLGVHRRLVDPCGRYVRRSFALLIQRWLWIFWKYGEWSRLGLPVAAFVVAGESGSMVVGAWGVSPTDGSSALASSHP
jgi:hypothetical protein